MTGATLKDGLLDSREEVRHQAKEEKVRSLQVGDSVYIAGHGPAIVVEIATREQGRGARGRKKFKVKYPNGTSYHVSDDMILACETHSVAKKCDVELQLPPSGPRHFTYLGRAFNDASRNVAIPSATFALVATMVGGGVLSLPYAMSQCGIALGTISLFVSALASTWTLDMLVDCARCTGRDTFELIGHAAFGEGSRQATVALVFVLCWLALVAYSVLLSDLFVPLVEWMIPSINDLLSNGGLHKATIVSATIIISPMCFASGLSALRFLCFAAVGSVVFVGVVIALRASQQFGHEHTVAMVLPDQEAISVTIDSEYQWWPKDWVQALYVFPIFGVSFMCHFNALPTHQELERPTRLRMRSVLVLCMSFTCVLYLFIGLSGYIFAGSCTCGNILLNFSKTDQLIMIARAALGLVLMFTFPLLCQPCRSALFRLIVGLSCRIEQNVADTPSAVKPPSPPVQASVHVYRRDRLYTEDEPLDSFCPKDETVQQGALEPTALQRYVLTVIILGSCLGLSCFLQSVLVVWSILGSTVCFLIGFILPAAFWRRITGPSATAFQRRASEILVVVSIMFAVCCTVQAATKLDVAPCPVSP